VVDFFCEVGSVTRRVSILRFAAPFTDIFGWLGGVRRLAEVKLQEGETLENALRRFKRKVQQEDIIKEVKRHSFYLKPGEKRRVKQALARKRNRKKSRREIE
jgi:small subunit ribosomal protein S21